MIRLRKSRSGIIKPQMELSIDLRPHRGEKYLNSIDSATIPEEVRSLLPTTDDRNPIVYSQVVEARRFSRVIGYARVANGQKFDVGSMKLVSDENYVVIKDLCSRKWSRLGALGALIE